MVCACPTACRRRRWCRGRGSPGSTRCSASSCDRRATAGRSTPPSRGYRGVSTTRSRGPWGSSPTPTRSTPWAPSAVGDDRGVGGHRATRVVQITVHRAAELELTAGLEGEAAPAGERIREHRPERVGLERLTGRRATVTHSSSTPTRPVARGAKVSSLTKRRMASTVRLRIGAGMATGGRTGRRPRRDFALARARGTRSSWTPPYGLVLLPSVPHCRLCRTAGRGVPPFPARVRSRRHAFPVSATGENASVRPLTSGYSSPGPISDGRSSRGCPAGAGQGDVRPGCSSRVRGQREWRISGASGGVRDRSAELLRRGRCPGSGSSGRWPSGLGASPPGQAGG